MGQEIAEQERDEYKVKYNDTYLALDDCARQSLKMADAFEKLSVAARMALEALTEYASIFENENDPETPANDAISALKSAGVT